VKIVKPSVTAWGCEPCKVADEFAARSICPHRPCPHSPLRVDAVALLVERRGEAWPSYTALLEVRCECAGRRSVGATTPWSWPLTSTTRTALRVRVTTASASCPARPARRASVPLKSQHEPDLGRARQVDSAVRLLDRASKVYRIPLRSIGRSWAEVGPHPELHCPACMQDPSTLCSLVKIWICSATWADAQFTAR
jgi:hypothetical protein